ncbi:MAG: hypothetical protein R3B84_03790 [Zavarzinella sp.]
MQEVVWGFGYPIGDDGQALWVYADFDATIPIDELFELVAEKLRKGIQIFAADKAKIFQSVVLFGFERNDNPENELHLAYNRMWAKHPDLWEQIQLRGFPMTFWAVDRADRAFFGIIQPAKGHEFLQVFCLDFRQSELYPHYEPGDPEWGMVSAPIHPETLKRARELREPNGV